ncbi:Translocase of chloroplast [Serendipita sp. 398]|nr:Translocase of chloroplast [Serendipita sp. 398]
MSSYGITRADKIIIVLGPTGTGKSTFIDYAIGGNGEGIGHSLISRTQEITVHKTVMGTPPQSFAFVDTPGFDDTTKPDYDVLTKIAEFLAKIQNDKLHLGKLLYLHRITDNRMDSAQLKNLELFAGMCDARTMSRVVLVTTMWKLMDPLRGRLAEKELKGDFWKKLIQQGCSVERFDDSSESVARIITGFSRTTHISGVDQEGKIDGIAISDQVTDPGQLQPSPSPLPPSTAVLKRAKTTRMHAKDRVILLLGYTGTGRSTFINAIGRGDNAVVNSPFSVQPCTKEISAFRLQSRDQIKDPIVLVDTPGFGTQSDYTVLGNISNWLEVHHAIDVVSILFFCQIENNRVTSSDVSTWENFKLLCGEAAMKASVTVVTTGWDSAESSNARYIDRESELRTHFWKECNFLRLERDTCSTFSTSARAILDNSVRSAPGSRLRIQTEMIHEKKPLEQTTLGQQHSQNRSTQRKLQKQVKDLVRSVRNGLILAFFRIGRLSL